MASPTQLCGRLHLLQSTPNNSCPKPAALTKHSDPPFVYKFGTHKQTVITIYYYTNTQGLVYPSGAYATARININANSHYQNVVPKIKINKQIKTTLNVLWMFPDLSLVEDELYFVYYEYKYISVTASIH